MPLQYSQWIWGFEVFDSGASQNNLLDFTRGSAKLAALNAGVYTVDEFYIEIARAMNAVDANTYTCTFDFSTLKFTIGGAASFTLNKNTGPNKTKGPWSLAGYDITLSDLTGTSLAAEVAVGTAPSTASVWTQSEPNSKVTPVAAGGIGSSAGLLQRKVKAIQNITDGMTVETIFFGTLKKVQVEFRALTNSDQTSMEAFLNWALAGKRFIWQPDKTSSNALKLVLAVPGEVNDDFEWLTRSESTYGTLTFYEQLS